MRVLRSAVFAASLLTICASGVSARPLMPAEERFLPYSGNLPLCDDLWVLNELSFDFSSNQVTYWGFDLEIKDYQKVREVGYRTNGVDLIPRRYCAAKARFSDGKTRVVKYNLIEGGGFIGIGHGLEYCVVGLDPEHAYSPNCDAAGP